MSLVLVRRKATTSRVENLLCNMLDDTLLRMSFGTDAGKNRRTRTHLTSFCHNPVRVHGTHSLVNCWQNAICIGTSSYETSMVTVKESSAKCENYRPRRLLTKVHSLSSDRRYEKYFNVETISQSPSGDDKIASRTVLSRLRQTSGTLH